MRQGSWFRRAAPDHAESSSRPMAMRGPHRPWALSARTSHAFTLHITQVEALSKEKGISVPADMLEIAAKFGLRLSALNTYFSLQVCAHFWGRAGRRTACMRGCALAGHVQPEACAGGVRCMNHVLVFVRPSSP